MNSKTLLWVGLGGVLAAILVLFLMPDTKMVPEPLPALSLPTDKKYHQVIKDEEVKAFFFSLVLLSNFFFPCPFPSSS